MDLFDDTYSEGVRDLQTFLRVIARSYPSVPFLITDGVYGDKTKSAVREVQGMLGLSRTGVVDFDTWSGIVRLAGQAGYEQREPRRARFFTPGRVYAAGDSADCVHIAQFIINCASREFDNVRAVEINGVLDARTADALVFLQECFKLPQTGQLDQVTWNRLNSLYDNLRTKKV